jgi:hypothetical protein
MNKKVGIILTSIERPIALKKSVQSILAVWQDNWALFIGLQDYYDSESFGIITKIIEENPGKEIRLYDLEYNCGISKARNELINKVAMWGIPYVFLTADSIRFNDMRYFDIILSSVVLKDYDLVGINIEQRIAWEANLNLIPNQSFELNFIDPKLKKNTLIVPCDIVRNFWLATTESLINITYDEQLIMCEHEDFFYKYKEAGYRVGCTDICNGVYKNEDNTPEYDKIRRTNFRIGKQRLLDKYSLKTWVSYNNIERIQQP